MKKRWFSLLLCLTLAVSLVLTGCSNATTDPKDSASPSADSSDDGGDAVTDTSTFTIGLAGEPPSFDPKDFNSTNAALTAYNVYDTLLDFGEDGETLEPCLAASWEMVDDVTYVYQIRDDITFSDGSALTIDDVVFSLDRIKNPDTAASMSYLFNSVESFEATGDYELTVHLAYPDATWKFVPATSPCTIISKSYYEAHAENYGTPDGTCLGTGPYMFESWASGSEIVLTKNENWWG